MASSSTLISQINADFLTCQICMDTFKKPKVLTCQHSFCQVCLESCETSSSGSYMSCPVCRSQTLLGMKGVSGLKDNFVFSNMIEMMETWNKSKSLRQKSTGSLQDEENMCGTCPSTAPVMATFQCLDCLDNLCADCAAFHTRAKLTKGHQVVLIEEIENGLHAERIRRLEITRCSEHKIEMKHFCTECDIQVCKDCIVDKHQSHDLISTDEAENQKRDEVSAMELELQASIQQLEGLISGVTDIQKTEKQRSEKKKTEINENAERLIEAVRRRQKYLNDEVDNVWKENVEKVKAIKEGLKTQLKCADNCMHLSKSLLEDRSQFEILTMHRQIRETVKELKNKTDEVLTRNEEIMATRTDIAIVFENKEQECERFARIAKDEEKVRSAEAIDLAKSEESLEKIRPITMPTPAPRRNLSSATELRSKRPQIQPRPITIIGSLMIEQNTLDNTPSVTEPRKPRNRLIRQNSDQDLSRSLESLNSQRSLSPARKAPEPPHSPMRKWNDNKIPAPKKGKAPKPPPMKPTAQPPLPPPQNKKPIKQNAKVLPLRATRLVMFGKRGKILTNGEFSSPPKSVKFSKSKKKIYTLDAESRHILVFTKEGFFKKSFNVSVPDQGAYVGKTKIVQSKPVDIAEAGRAHILVLFRTFVVRWGWQGKLDRLWGTNELTDATSIETDSEGRILVSDQEKHMIFVYNPYTLENIMQLGGFGDRDNLFKSPRCICINQFDDIIVSDHHNHCIKIFDREGRFLMKCGERGTDDWQLKYPEGVATVRLDDGNDGILVADEGNSRISLFTSEGRFLCHALTQVEDKGLKAPQDISVSCTGEEMIIRQINSLQVKVYKLNKVETS